MARPADARGPDPQHSLLRERLARAAAAEDTHARARAWSDATDEERVAAFVELSRICVEIARAGGAKAHKPDLPVIRIRSRKS